MGLEIFGTAEKPTQERNLQVVVSEEAILGEWGTYLDQTAKGLIDYSSLRPYFLECQKFLKSYKINPRLILRFYKKFCKKDDAWMAKRFRGDFLSAMIQTSYNQGFNNFKFGEVDAGFFGNSLEGKEGNTLIIDVGKIVGEGALCDANNCSLTARLVRGERCLAYAQKCAITTDTLHGIWAFQDAKHCVATIQKYDGSHFGQWMENCKIYSRNKAVLDRLIAQTHTYKDNSFTFLSSD